VLNSVVLQLVNLFTQMYHRMWLSDLYPEEWKANHELQIIVLVVILVIFLFIFWKGTRFDIMFSNRNMFIMAFAFLFYVGSQIYIIASYPFNVLTILDTQFFLGVLNVFTVLWLMIQWVYYGKIKRKFKYDKSKHVVDNNQIIYVPDTD